MNEKDKTTRNDVSKNKRSLEQIPIKFDSNSQLREFVSSSIWSRPCKSL